jgi:putative sterol carrier protein
MDQSGSEVAKTSESKLQNKPKDSFFELPSTLDKTLVTDGLNETQIDDLKNFIMANDTAVNDLFYGNTDVSNKTYAFMTRNVRDDGKRTVVVPLNYKDINSSLVKIVMSILARNRDKIKLSNCEAFSISEDDESKRFFTAFFSTLLRSPMEKETISFKQKNASSRGMSAAKYCFLRESLSDKQALVYLPDEAYIGEKKQNVLSYYLRRIAGGSDLKFINPFYSTVMRLIGDITKSNLPKWQEVVDKYTVPVSTVLDGMHRTKKQTTGKGRKAQTKVITIKPKRPSTRVEILSEAERAIIIEDEKCFDQLHKLIFDDVEKKPLTYKLEQIEELRKKVKALISECWDAVTKYSAALTSRAKLFSETKKELGIEEERISKQAIEKWIEGIHRNKATGYFARKLSPKKLLLIMLKDDMVNRSLVDRYFRKYDPRILALIHDDTVREVILSWAQMFKIPTALLMEENAFDQDEIDKMFSFVTEENPFHLLLADAIERKRQDGLNNG